MLVELGGTTQTRARTDGKNRNRKGNEPVQDWRTAQEVGLGPRPAQEQAEKTGGRKEKTQPIFPSHLLNMAMQSPS